MIEWKLSTSAEHIMVFTVRWLSRQTLDFNIFRSFFMGLPDSLEKPLLILMEGKILLPALFGQVNRRGLGSWPSAFIMLKSTFNPLILFYFLITVFLIFIWLRRVLVAACGLSSCGAWALEHAGLVAPRHVGC